MRPIKFRAWDIRNKCYWKWELKKFSNRGMTNSHYVFVNGDIWSEFGEILDDPNYIIDQFTGLLDKNGKEIYEGDIVSWNSHRGSKEIKCVGEVSYATVGFWVVGRPDVLSNIYVEYRKLEVIGNIYENPELLIKEV